MNKHKKMGSGRLILGILVILTFGLMGCGKDDSADTSISGSSISDTAALDVANDAFSDEMNADTETAALAGTLVDGISEETAASVDTFLDGTVVSADGTEASASENVSLTTSSDGMPLISAENDADLSSQADANNITIANISGKDFATLNVTFSAGSLQNTDILGGEILKDGTLFSYPVADMSTLVNTANLKVSITATTKTGEEVIFASIPATNPSGMVLVLDVKEDGYYMYAK